MIQRSKHLLPLAVSVLLTGFCVIVAVLDLKLPLITEPRQFVIILALIGMISTGLASMVLWNLRKASLLVGNQIQSHETKSGSLILHSGHSALRPILEPINQYLQISNQRMDETRRKTRELEIQLKVVQLEREQTHSIIQSISDAVLVTDPWDELVLANESATRALNFRKPSDGRKPIADLIHDPKLVSLIREMRASRTAGGRRVVEHHTKSSGEDRTYKITLSSLTGNNANVDAGVVAVMHDMTKEAEVAQMKNDFVSHVSHELRTPLASIKAYVEMLIDGEATDTKQQQEFYDVIQNEANRLGRLIDNILDISRIESGVVKINKVPLSITIVVKEALEIITPQAATKQITVRDNIPPALHQVLADKDMIHRAVLNLLSNSVKYTPEQGTITVGAVVDEAAKLITIRISDTGVGIPEKDLPRLFEKFYRVEANNKMAKGTGLGLSLVKHIVETVHHGRIFVESTVGKGSTFGIELPIC